MIKRKIYPAALISSLLVLAGCSKQPEVEEAKPMAKTVTKPVTAPATQSFSFSVTMAQDNLTFAKDQYLKMISHVENKQNLYYRPECKQDPSMLCIPRSQEHGAIFVDKYGKWTNGFFPGVMWKLLSNKDNIQWSSGQEQKLYDSAKYFQQALESDVGRTSTHDLGFLLYDSYGEALHYDELDSKTRQQYSQYLDVGRAALATRFSDEKGLIRSWDWAPHMKLTTIENGEQKVDLYSLSNPWQFPVIIDNMMNLEFLFDSDVERYHEIAFSHAKYTLENHYFYDEADKAQQYPLSYHVFDYGENKPGNWQGLGNVSAWARGQGWSLYGYLTVVEAMAKTKVDLSKYPDFDNHLNRLLGSIEHLLGDEYVPYWDFWAARDNAYEYAENVSPDTAIYSGILELCAKRLEDHITPYKGYKPQRLDASLLSDESLKRLQGKKNWYGEDVIQGDKIVPCGSKPYPANHQKIPRDTSASALFASALYQFAIITKDDAKSQKYADLADKIMLELTNNYRTDRNQTRKDSLGLGFVLAEATGNMGSAGEIDTPIVYGDFYFIEANARKIAYEQRK
ncbi:hypothetical protein C2869_02560 [Saccharobesus litoralis]|uniref:Uncharacterized protein n=1 Tax=Saccharobesus litoralis TaxID=2172099 RepID=A0A2S0VMI7_9ALTE|nr:hypothetical protein [Saccharobesus litoralis]AWB65389.1 hypothetical protein C2869_02560 [Saccharobesus litoralis]